MRCRRVPAPSVTRMGYGHHIPGYATSTLPQQQFWTRVMQTVSGIKVGKTYGSLAAASEHFAAIGAAGQF